MFFQVLILKVEYKFISYRSCIGTRAIRVCPFARTLLYFMYVIAITRLIHLSAFSIRFRHLFNNDTRISFCRSERNDIYLQYLLFRGCQYIFDDVVMEK